MGGAYVAKSATTVSLDYPPGWNPIWYFPGPWPPGYAPELSTPITAPRQIAANSPSATITLTLVDQAAYQTQSPTDNEIVWEVSHSYSGGPAAIYTEIGDDFWGSSGTATFANVQVGDTITITATSDPFGFGEILGSASIDVVEEPQSTWRIELEGTGIPSSSAAIPDFGWYYAGATWDAQFHSAVGGLPFAEINGWSDSLRASDGSGYENDLDYYSSAVESEYVAVSMSSATEGTIQLTMPWLGGQTWYFYFTTSSDIFGVGSCSVSASVTIRLYFNDVLKGTLSYNQAGGGDEYIEEGRYAITLEIDGTYSVATF